MALVLRIGMHSLLKSVLLHQSSKGRANVCLSLSQSREPRELDINPRQHAPWREEHVLGDMHTSPTTGTGLCLPSSLIVLVTHSLTPNAWSGSSTIAVCGLATSKAEIQVNERKNAHILHIRMPSHSLRR